MSRQRFIHPAIFTSEDFISLSPNARLMWIGMFTLADDHGRGHASPVNLKASIFPADPLSIAEVSALRSEVAGRGMVQVYQVGSTPYYLIPKWRTYQRPTWVKPSIIPDPVKEADQSHDSEPITNRSPTDHQPAINRSPDRSPYGDVDRDGLDRVGSDRLGSDRVGLGRIGSDREPQLEVRSGGPPDGQGNREIDTDSPPQKTETETQKHYLPPDFRKAVANLAMETKQGPGEASRQREEKSRAKQNSHRPKRPIEEMAWEVVTLCLAEPNPDKWTADDKVKAAVATIGGWDYLGMLTDPIEARDRFLEAYKKPAQPAQKATG